MLSILKCNLCPRMCLVNRRQEKGVCKASNKLEIAAYKVHMWEEPTISGTKGSGTIFFSNCNLKCIFCQNRQISTDGYGKECTLDEFSNICLKLQDVGVHNINLVTPTHYSYHIIKGIKKAKDMGLKIPIVYNTSGYERVEVIKQLKNTVDIYLTDLKYYDDNLAIKYSHVKDYFKYASAAIEEMYKQTGKNIFKNGIMQKGIIVRILVLPGHTQDAKILIKYLYDKYRNNIYISIMNQYTPLRKFKIYTNLNRILTDEEYNDVVLYACDMGVTNAYIQEGKTQTESFIPDFTS